MSNIFNQVLIQYCRRRAHFSCFANSTFVYPPTLTSRISHQICTNYGEWSWAARGSRCSICSILATPVWTDTCQDSQAGCSLAPLCGDYVMCMSEPMSSPVVYVCVFAVGVADSGSKLVQSLCKPPAEPCDNTSRKFFDFCDQGICCYNRLAGQEYCA